ncbi:HNH endonuclease signature motif containing protein [Nocardia heshunensis]
MTSGATVLDDITIADAIAMLARVTDTLLCEPLTTLSDDEFVVVMREYETSKRRLAGFEHRLIDGVETRCLPQKAGWKARTDKYLEDTLHLSHADATSRVRAAALLGAHQHDGQALPPVLASTANLQEQGQISADHARVIAKLVDRIPEKINPAQRAKTEAELADLATRSTPDDLRTAAARVLDRLDPDGTATTDADRQRRRGVILGKQGIDGMSTISGELTPTARALLDPIFADLARPGMCNPADPESPWRAEGIDPAVIEAAAQRDNRTAAQRQHDALVAFLRPELGPTNLGQHRGLPVSAIFTMTLAEVEAAAGVATTASGGTVPLEEALALAEKAKPFLAVFDHHSRPLHLGHSKKNRLANTAQRLALIAAERGCTRPGCNAPATLTQVHHVTDWAKGGATDIENLTLACDACHSLIGDGPQDWKTVVMPADSEHAGRIGWIAPRHLDPTRSPRVNDRHHGGELAVGRWLRP